MGERVTASELARRAGVTRGAVSVARQRGRVERGADGLYDVDQALRQLAETKTRPGGPGRGGAAHAASGSETKPAREKKTILHWKTIEARETALTKRLGRLERQGRLVRRDVAEAEFAGVFANLRTHLEPLGRTLQDELAAETEPRRCGEIVDSAVRHVLDRMVASADEGDGAADGAEVSRRLDADAWLGGQDA